MWKTYRHTESEGDYTIYKEAFNQTTAEIRHSERCYEQKIAFNIKLDTKSFYAYVRVSTLVRCLPGKILMHYQYQRLSSKGEIQIIKDN
jgi:hypothetical protein